MSSYLSPWSSVKYFCRIDLSDEVIVVQRLMKTKVKTPKPSVAATTSEMRLRREMAWFCGTQNIYSVIIIGGEIIHNSHVNLDKLLWT